MCFYNDYEWSVSVSEDTTGAATEAVRCDECGAKIAIGETCRYIYQQEHEECQTCEDNCSENYIDRVEMTELLGTDEDDWAKEHLKTLDDHEHDYGETFDYYCCDSCDKVRRAVIDREKSEGCPEDAQQPSLCSLWDAILEHDDRREYALHAVAMFPELKGNPLLMRLLGESDGAE